MSFKARLRVFFSMVLIVVTGPAFGRTIQLIGFGDSLMAGYELPAEQAFPARLEKLLRDNGHDVTIANAGVSGDTTADGLARLDWSIPDGTDGVILELGANDALRGLSPRQSRDNLEAILKRLKERNIPVLLVGIFAPPNMGSGYEKEFNPIFPELARQYDVVFYPFFLDGVALVAGMQLADGMHPSAEGTKVMAERLRPVAEDFIGRMKTMP